MAAPNQNADPRMNTILTPVFNRPNAGIVPPDLGNNQWELKSNIIQLAEREKYGGEDDEDPHKFVDRFLRICDSTKPPHVSDDAIRLRLFPFAVKGKALDWMERQPAESILTWENLSEKFFAEFFPMEKYNNMVNDITSFKQHLGETICASWNRFKALMRKVPHYNLSQGDQVRIFFNGCLLETKLVVNTAAGGSLGDKLASESYQLIDKLAKNENETTSMLGKRGVVPLRDHDAVLAEQKLLSQQMTNLNTKFERMQLSKVQANAVNVECEYCHENHDTNACPTLMSSYSSQQLQVNGVWYDQRPNQQNYQRRNYQGTGLDMKSDNYLKPPPIPQREPSDLERLVGSLAQSTNAFIEESRADARNTKASIKNLENQIGCIAITTRSGKVVASPPEPIIEVEEDEKVEEVEKSEKEAESSPKVVKPVVAGKQKDQPDVSKEKFELSEEYLMKMAPYPGRLKPELKAKSYDRFLDIFKKLHVNIPFAEALASMPNYAKFMKDLLSRKHKLQECQTVALTEECSAIITRKFPPKLRDPGSFNIEIEIGETKIGRALCDLGASINLMPLSVCKALGITELKPTLVSLQLADRSLRKPSVENEMPLLLGRPFLATARAMIDVEQGKLV
ncbi:uncharacterized protein LOC133296027 [Gastrolobium bilobum]|uniref:uncharacterized protein LOC133296027 n=1 Tax=Gastrolobium bilobum TaxID=150636 RepID=UPI002AB0C973|nr:uncharacterized protein LOC133296027 [Gastrolobium bilobum]